MAITEQGVEQAFRENKATCGGVREDYFGLLYLEQEHRIPRQEALNQIAFGSHDFGIDGFHFDRDRRNFYLFQFKYSTSHEQFKASFRRLIEDGMQQLFDAQSQGDRQNPIIPQIKSCLRENQAIIERFYFHFVFMGDPDKADQSCVLTDLKETLENKKYLIDNFLERNGSSGRDEVSLVVEFKSATSRRVGKSTVTPKTQAYRLRLSEGTCRTGPANELMHVAFVRLADLQTIYGDLNSKFFERNIRAALPPEVPVNRALKTALRRIVIDQTQPPQSFAFNHNGVTLAAEAVDQAEDGWTITAPRLLNGAQTVATFAKFIEENKGNKRLEAGKQALDQVEVLCRIIVKARPDFVTEVTINNNRQNPVKAWNLRANDEIQLQLADKFRDEVQIFYERHEHEFRALRDEDLEELDVQSYKAINIYELAQTFAIVDGDIEKLSRLPEIFEDETKYAQLFAKARLRADCRKIVLCYKAGLYTTRLIRAVCDKGRKYEFVKRGRNILWALVCQAMLNDQELEDYLESHGKNLRMEKQFRDWLLYLATQRCRFLLSLLVEDKLYAEKAADGSYSFLKSTAAFNRTMDLAYKRFRWTKQGIT